MMVHEGMQESSLGKYFWGLLRISAGLKLSQGQGDSVVNLSIEQTTRVILEVAASNRLGDFQKAIELMALNLGSFDPVLRIEGLHQFLKAAEGARDELLIEAIKQEMAKPFSDLASLRQFLK